MMRHRGERWRELRTIEDVKGEEEKGGDRRMKGDRPTGHLFGLSH